ncbi:EthD domain-containing protein [Herbiconiux sp.]|uniref:EthD domain-containing protein n=1 Tax=Herbiconiux sp. TaxID=1871186 RepID=UPI0025B9A3C9|nr:EthD domain-containing protein [Herbiconiux sp.]
MAESSPWRASRPPRRVTPSDTDLSHDGRDPDAFLTMVNTLRRRRSVPEDLFYEYWRDAHVQIAARLPGIHSLFTHWVAFDEQGRWPRVEGIDGRLAEELRFDGVPEPTFLTEAAVGDFVQNMAPLMQDERNIFEETISYPSLGGGSRTLVDRLPDPAPAGEQGVLRMLVYLRRRDTVSHEDFHAWIRDEFAPALSGDPQVLKLRRHLLEPYDDDAVVLDAGADSVSHRKAPHDQYQAMIEIVFADDAGLDAFRSGPVWQGSIAAQQRHLAATHPFLATRTYCMRFNGELTTAGLRTAAVAEQIQALSAANQLDPAVRRLVQTGSV